MTTDPGQIRADVSALLADLPDPGAPGVDIEVIAARLDAAHDYLIRALQSVERNPTNDGPEG